MTNLNFRGMEPAIETHVHQDGLGELSHVSFRHACLQAGEQPSHEADCPALCLVEGLYHTVIH